MPTERQEVVDAIHESPNLSAATRRLGMSRKTLYNRMRHYNLPRGRAGRPKKRFRRRGQGIARVIVAGATIVGAVLLVRSRTSA